MDRIPTRRALPALALALLLGAAACSAPEGQGDYDPWQGMNRGLFGFNMGFDDWILEPTAQGWDWMLPDAGQNHLAKFFVNLAFPVRFVGSLLQGEVVGAGTELGRFVINITVGLLGFFDPASDWGLEANEEDVGQAFGAWGFGPGPYIVLPFLGPSDGRDAIGLIFDLALNPTTYFFPARVIAVINWRAINLELIAENRASALDFYVFVRNAWLQQRDALVHDRPQGGEGAGALEEDIYDID